MLLKSSKLTKSQKEVAVGKIFDQSAPKIDFYLMLILSAIIVTLGLLINSPGVVIGGMLIAPILSPMLGLSLGVVIGNADLMKRTGAIIIWSSFIVIFISLIISSFYVNGQINSEILSRTSPSLAYLIIAIVSGAAVTYALVRPSISEILPGIAIAVALIPPLATVGISISFFSWDMMVGSLELFLVNLIGIIFASVSIFSIMRVYEVHDVVEKKLRCEKKLVMQEKRAHDIENIENLEKTIREAEALVEEKKRK